MICTAQTAQTAQCQVPPLPLLDLLRPSLPICPFTPFTLSYTFVLVKNQTYSSYHTQLLTSLNSARAIILSSSSPSHPPYTTTPPKTTPSSARHEQIPKTRFTSTSTLSLMRLTPNHSHCSRQCLNPVQGKRIIEIAGLWRRSTRSSTELVDPPLGAAPWNRTPFPSHSQRNRRSLALLADRLTSQKSHLPYPISHLPPHIHTSLVPKETSVPQFIPTPDFIVPSLSQSFSTKNHNTKNQSSTNPRHTERRSATATDKPL